MNVRAAFLVGLLVSVAIAGEGGDDADAPKWNVDDPGGPYRELAFETTEGTWMSVDVHPDGSRLVFDLHLPGGLRPGSTQFNNRFIDDQVIFIIN